jgi:tetratricopeptide (TPR) repeat protein
MIDIKQIADDIYNKEKPKTPRDFIANFKKHQQAIESVDYNSAEDTYDTYSQLIGDYGIALAETQSYKKAIPVLDKALDLLIKNKRFAPDTLPNLAFYETLLFKRGQSYYNLDKFELAKPDFELLIKLYPDNSIYPKWVNAIKNGNLIRLRNILWYCVAGAVIIENFFNNRTLMKYLILGFGVLSLISVVVLEIVFYFKKRKYGA